MENNNKNNTKINRTKKTKLELEPLRISTNNELYKRFSLNIYEEDRNLEYSFKIVTENGNIDANEWEETSYYQFPIEIQKIEIDNIIYENGSIKQINTELTKDNDLEIIFEKKITNIRKIWYGIKLQVQNKNITNINGKIFYKSLDSNVEVNIEREGD